MSPDQPRLDRRTVLGTVGSVAVVAVAGCLGDGDETGDTGETPTQQPTETADGGETPSTDQYVDVPESESCAVCNMTAADHPDWNAQLVHESDQRVFFCSSGCLAAYNADPQRFDGPESPIANAWVTGFETGEFLDAADAHFVRVTDSDHVDDIMKTNPTPFADRADAESFVAEFDAYDESDIIGFDDFDMELAQFYRGKFFEEGSE